MLARGGNLGGWPLRGAPCKESQDRPLGVQVWGPHLGAAGSGLGAAPAAVCTCAGVWAEWGGVGSPRAQVLPEDAQVGG